MHLSNEALLVRQVENENHGPQSSSIELSITATPTAAASTSTPTAFSDKKSSSSTMIIIVVIVVASLVIFTILLISLRRLRQKHRNPKYIPTPFLKRLWTKWEPAKPQRLTDGNESLEPISSSRTTGLRAPGSSANPPSSFDAAARNAVENAAGGVDRNTSVRSVMTLPAYHQNALHNEQVLGREGDRGGIDVVIEFPETQDEEERLREEEMEALYQVRLARRRENEEREERRRLRREARERGDYVALREIAARARAQSGANASNTVEELRAEHDRIKKERQRAVSSVSYADLGVARHDGTRLRANSQDSERQGLLGDAASIAASSQYHRRDRSASSIISIDTMQSDLPSPRLTRSRATSRAESPGRASQQTERERAGSSPEMVEHDDIPPNSPPGYENISLDTPNDESRRNPLEPPPGYSSPVVGRGEGPSIEDSVPQTQHPLSHTSPSISPERSEQRPSIRDSPRRSSHIGSMISTTGSRDSSSSSLSANRPQHERRGSRGVGGVPQLPSLRLGSLPSIQVDPGSPRVGRVDEERDLGDGHSRS